MNLTWESDEKDQNRWLFAGSNGAELAWLEKRQKFWSATIWLPDCEPVKKYAPLDQQVAGVEAIVRSWFLRCLGDEDPSNFNDHPALVFERFKRDASALLDEIQRNETQDGGLLSRQALVLASTLGQTLSAVCMCEVVHAPQWEWCKVVNTLFPMEEMAE